MLFALCRNLFTLCMVAGFSRSLCVAEVVYFKGRASHYGWCLLPHSCLHPRYTVENMCEVISNKKREK